MPGQTQRPRRFVPSGLSDATDGSNVFAGACSRLTNLIPHPNARGVFVPRPAMIPQATLPDWAGGPVGKIISLGNVFYGFYPSAQFAGFDRPFRYDPQTNTFFPISGMSAATLPVTQPTTGDWQPPAIAQVAGRIVFTHPGFAGGITVPQLALSIGVQTTTGSNVVQGPPNLSQSIVGCVASGAGIPAGATVTAVAQSNVYTTGTGTTASTTITVASTAGLVSGMSLFGPGIASIITAVGVGNVTVPNPPTQNFSSASLQFTGSNLTLSQNATATGSSSLNIASPTPGIKFGWLDISGFSTSLNATTTSGSTNLSGDPTLVGIGIQPGMTVAGPGIAAGTTVQTIGQVNLQAYGQLAAQSQIFQLGNVFNLTAQIAPGQSISGPNISPNTTVLSYNNSTYQVTMSQASTNLSTAGATLTFSGTDIQLSQAATSSSTQQTYNIAGGTPSAPLWGAGDLSVNPLIGTTPAVFVAQFGNRAWYGVNTSNTSAVQASDAGTASIQTNISQTLGFVNGIPVTTAAGMPLSNQLGGIIQSLMVFQGSSLIQQITGDFSQNNIAVNALQTATGTLSPDAITSTPRGLLFPAADGIRLIGFDGSITDPIGGEGQGLSLPFQTVATPSRTHAAFNENTYRITITWQPPVSATANWGTAPRTDEFWYHFSEVGRAFAESRWSGPHPSILDAAAPWPAQASFIVAPQAARGQLYRADPWPTVNTSYTELGTQLSCDLKTLLLPDNPEQNAIAIIETTVWVGYSSADGEIYIRAVDDFGQLLDHTYVWIGPFSTASQRAVPWHFPLVFRQMSLEMIVGATALLQLGALNVRDEVLNYQLPYPVPDGFVLGNSALGGPGGLGTIPVPGAPPSVRIPILETAPGIVLRSDTRGDVMQTGGER